MNYERQIIEWKPESLGEAARFFERLSGSDPANPDPKYGSAVENARELVCNETVVRAVLRRAVIESRDEDSVTLATGQVLTGKMPVRALEHAQELYAFVVTLNGFEKVKSSDIMTAFFADTWGSAYVECAQAKLGELVSALTGEEGMIRTHMWCPGQHTFDLKNQKALFDFLNPEDIGCSLTGKLMMVPVKSASGIMGVVPEGTADMPKPCDYCPFKAKCPASMNGCAAL